MEINKIIQIQKELKQITVLEMNNKELVEELYALHSLLNEIVSMCRVPRGIITKIGERNGL